MGNLEIAAEQLDVQVCGPQMNINTKYYTSHPKAPIIPDDILCHATPASSSPASVHVNSGTPLGTSRLSPRFSLAASEKIWDGKPECEISYYYIVMEY